MKPPETSPLAIASLAFSCLGIFSFGLLAVPGIICGMIARRQVSQGRYSGGSLAGAGVIVGAGVLLLFASLAVACLLATSNHLYRTLLIHSEMLIMTGAGVLSLMVLILFFIRELARRRTATMFPSVDQSVRSR